MNKEQNIEDESQGERSQSTENARPPARSDHSGGDDPVGRENISEPSTINYQPSTKMEVQKHPHHITHKKKWGEYLLEFLMLFLAVFLGFVAENFREDISDGSKEKQYIHSLYDDMHQDSIRISASLAFTGRQIQKIDSLIYIINQTSPDSNEINAAYFCARIATRAFYFEETDRTIQQLNNTGNFRLIKNIALADSIIEYEKNLAAYKDNRPTDIQERQFLYPFIASIFDANVFQIMVDSSNRIQRISGLHTIDISDKKLNNRFIYYLHQAKSTMAAEKIYLLKILQQTSDIRNIIRENFNIQN